MNGKLTAPQIDYYLSLLYPHNVNDSVVPDEESLANIDRIFAAIKDLAPSPDGFTKELWLCAERGTFETYSEVVKLRGLKHTRGNPNALYLEWKNDYPNECCWYHFEATEDIGTERKSIFINNRLVFEIVSKVATISPKDMQGFTGWMNEAVDKCMSNIRADIYNLLVDANLPSRLKTGYIMRRDLWDVFPEERAEFFYNLTREEVSEFTKHMKEQPNNLTDIEGRMTALTAGDFFRICALGYAANIYRGNGKTPKKQYIANSGGKESGLVAIDENSPEAFEKWIASNFNSDNSAWEVCRGGAASNISLYPVKDSKGYLLFLAGDSLGRTVETVKFYLALKREGIPVFMSEGKILADRLREKELVGVVPVGIIPSYCETMFPDRHIIDFINLPDEKEKDIADKCVWYPIAPAKLIGTKLKSPARAE